MSLFEQQLMARLEDYALRVITLYGTLPDYPAAGHQVAQVIGKQLLRSGTAVGANYAEATRGRGWPGFAFFAGTAVGANYAEATRTHSVADKAAKQQICIKELEETAYWLRLLSKAGLIDPLRLEPLLAETGELTAIFVASVRKLQSLP